MWETADLIWRLCGDTATDYNFYTKRAILSGRLAPGERFPSIRSLGKELGVNPNTVQRIVASLT